MATNPTDVRWDLSDLYAGVDDPVIEQDLQSAAAAADRLAKTYRGKIAGLDAPGVVALAEAYQECLEQIHRVGTYAQLNWTLNTTDPARGALLQKVTEHGSRMQQQLVFIELEWATVSEEAAQAVLQHPGVERIRHFLTIARRYRPYLLSEPEERILVEKQVTSSQAWSRLFDQVHGGTSYQLGGAPIEREQLLSKLYEHDREVRRGAAAAVTEGLRSVLPTTTYIFNTLLADKASTDRLRAYPTWVSQRNMDNEVDDATVDALVSAVTSRYDIVQRYYTLKRGLLGLDELADYDRYAPLQSGESRHDWDQARDLVLDAYSSFAPELGAQARKFFDNPWIDAPIQKGKRGGAFCHPSVPSHHPYLLLNFDGSARDVMTLAHELGHGVHALLAAGNSYLQFGTPLTTAETASVFGEMLVFNSLLAKQPEPRERLAMLVRRIEDSFATVFRQVSMNRFEAAIHEERREQGELTSERFGELWRETQEAMFQGSVTLTPDYSIWWSYIPHFISTPGYVYAYAFGELLVLALYARYQEIGEVFADGYLQLLAAGGSDWPHELVKPLGIDLTDHGFWAKGLQMLDDLVQQAQTLAAQL